MKMSDGWMRTGSNPEQYEMGEDDGVLHNESESFSIRFESSDEPKSFGALAKSLSAQKYLDKRVRMTAFVKTDHADWAGLWMRIDGDKPDEPLAFDNMFTRQIKGTTDWKRYEVVLDVSGKAQDIVFGLSLTGKGQVWSSDFRFEEVGNDVPTTDKKSRKSAAR